MGDELHDLDDSAVFPDEEWVKVYVGNTEFRCTPRTVEFAFEDAAVRRTSAGEVLFVPDHTVVRVGDVQVYIGTKRLHVLFEGEKLWEGVIPNRDGHG